MLYNTRQNTLKYQRNEGWKELVVILKAKCVWYIILHNNIHVFPIPILLFLLSRYGYTVLSIKPDTYVCTMSWGTARLPSGIV